MKFSFGHTMQHVSAGLVVLVFAVLISWQRLTPITVNDSKTTTPEIYAGEKLEVVRNVTWHRVDCSNVSITSDIVDVLGFNHILTPQYLGAPDLKTVSDREWPTPFILPYGKSVYKAKITFLCPPLYNLYPNTIDLPDLEFVVREAPIQQGTKEGNTEGNKDDIK